MLIMVCYFKRICGINQAEDRVTWPDLLHRHTITFASFREWSVVSAWLRIQAQPWNPCQSRNSASASTCSHASWRCDRMSDSTAIFWQACWAEGNDRIRKQVLVTGMRFFRISWFSRAQIILKSIEIMQSFHILNKNVVKIVPWS